MRVLLVEDEWLIREVFAEALAESGFEVREAETGDRASALIAEASAPFSLLVTDIHMPGRRDGIEVARVFRARWPDVPVIYTTGRPDVLNGTILPGARDVLLRKPFAPFELLAATRRVLDRNNHHVR